MEATLYQVDAFTDRPFSGNPAAVCILPEPAEESWMQNLAEEMNLSETAFLLRTGDLYSLRWFTPVCEVDLCGHATLAGAHALWEEGEASPDAPLRFQTNSGALTAERRAEWIELNFPSEPPEGCDIPEDVIRALGVNPSWTGKNRFDFLVRVRTMEELENLSPDFGLLKASTRRGVMLTCPSEDSRYDFCSRFFAPAVGLNEDPVTGSAHCCLGPYWMEELGVSELVGYQASPRGGTVRVRVKEDRVILSGQAVTVFRGALRL